MFWLILPALAGALGLWREHSKAPAECREIIRLLLQCYEARGLELVKRSGGKLRHGTIYVRLDQLIQDGVVVDRMEYDDRVAMYRGYYRLSGDGRALAEELFA